MTGRRLTVHQTGKVGKGEESQLTQQQISELLETEGARSLVEAAEERGHVEPTELEAFALEHDLDDADVEQLTRELEAIGLEVNDPRSEEDAKPAQPEPKAASPVIVGNMIGAWANIIEKTKPKKIVCNIASYRGPAVK